MINALTARSHPCQIMADLQTMIERHGALEGQVVTWIGDGNNVAASWIEAAARFGFQLRIACPEGYAPPAELLAWARAEGADLVLYDSAMEAAAGSQTLVTDVWISMGDEEGTRREDFGSFQVNQELLEAAAGDAIVLHCLPAWRGMEITAEVIDGPQSAVFDEAENRLHAQKRFWPGAWPATDDPNGPWLHQATEKDVASIDASRAGAQILPFYLAGETGEAALVRGRLPPSACRLRRFWRATAIRTLWRDCRPRRWPSPHAFRPS